MDSSQGPKIPMMGELDVRIPAQVDVAFDILKWGNAIETGQGGKSYEEAHTEGRDLRISEKAVYDAALEILRLYLTGEMNFHGDDSELEESLEESLDSSEPCFFCKDKS